MIGSPNRRAILLGAVAAAIAPRLARAHSGVVHEVKIERFRFVPDRLQVRIGDHIRWTNLDLAPHTATALEFEWDSAELARGDRFELEVTADIAPEYFCAYHPHMTGSIVVI